jgi:PEP-CTERM motif
MVYYPGLLQLYLTDFSTPILSAKINRGTLLNLQGGRNAFIGFTSSTGGAWGNHDIVGWPFTNVPEPGTLGLIGVGLVFGGLLRRRRTA